MKTRLTLALLGLASGLSLTIAPAAHAGTAAPLPDCDDLGYRLSALLPGGTAAAGCSVGDKNFFGFTYADTKPANQIGVTIGGSPMVHTVNFTALSSGGSDPFWPTGTGSIMYKVEVNNRSTETIKQLAGGFTSSLTGSQYVWAVDTTQSHSGGPCLGDENVSNCTMNPINYSPFVEYAEISNDWQVTSGAGTGITQITNSIYQTPGPLPLLGAGAAFGFSRKLRQRVKISG